MPDRTARRVDARLPSARRRSERRWVRRGARPRDALRRDRCRDLADTARGGLSMPSRARSGRRPAGDVLFAVRIVWSR